MIKYLICLGVLLVFLQYCQSPQPPDDLYDPRDITRVDNHWEARPDMAVDSRGLIHLVYQSGVDNISPVLIYYIKQLEGGGWSTPLRLSDSTENQFSSPQIAIDSRDNIHVVWEGEDLRTFYTVKLPNEAWSQPQPITLTHNPLPQIVSDEQNNLHMVGMGGNRGTYRQKLDDHWLAEESLPNTLSNASMAVSSDGTVHVVFETANQLIGYLRRTTDGTWHEWEQVSPGDTSLPVNGYPWIADVAEYLDTVYVSWTVNYTKNILLRKRYPDGTWSAIDTLPWIEGSPRISKLKIDNRGIFLAWEEEHTGSKYNIYYLLRTFGGAWSSPTDVSKSPFPSLEFCMVLTHNKLFLTWQELLDDSIYGNIDIYFQAIDIGGI